VPQLLGLVAIGGALLTDYELGVMRVIPMPVHLGIDIASALCWRCRPGCFGLRRPGVLAAPGRRASWRSAPG
jgi:hypothetical protein